MDTQLEWSAPTQISLSDGRVFKTSTFRNIKFGWTWFSKQNEEEARIISLATEYRKYYLCLPLKDYCGMKKEIMVANKNPKTKTILQYSKFTNTKDFL